MFPALKTSSALTATAECTCNEFLWEEGRAFLDNEFDFSLLEYKIETAGEKELTEFSVTDLAAPINSSRVKEILEEFEIDTQFYPVKIYSYSGTLISDVHFALNLTKTIYCIDFDNSLLEIEKEEGDIVDIISVETIMLKEQFLRVMYRMYLFE